MRKLYLLFLFLFVAGLAFGQTKGMIFKTAGAGAAVLDPDGNGYTSATTSGFTYDDEEESEIPYVPMPVVSPEPDSDLGPGPDCGFTDLVKSPGNETIYTYSDGNNLLFRFRLGGTAPNSKGYSVLVDTDNRFGFSGPNADPDAVAGNPGFEVEIVLRTNFGVGIYNINGTTSGTETGSATADRSYENFAQKSIALTEVCGDDDYFYDFYVPYADLPFDSSTPVRMVGNTVINPHPAMGNNGISDLGGVDDATGITDNLWEDLIDIFPPTSGDEIKGGSTLATRSECPKINALAVGLTSVSGSSVEAEGTDIEVFVDGDFKGTVKVLANKSWSLSGLPALAQDQIVTATAKAPGESVSVSNCNPARVGGVCSVAPTGLAFSSGSKGITGNTTEAAGSIVRVYDYATGALWTGATGGTGNPVITTVAPTTTSPTVTWEVAGQQGQNLANGIYYATIQAPDKCESVPSAFICKGVTASLTPTISTSPIISVTTFIEGSFATAPVGTYFVKLYIDGVEMSYPAEYSTGGSWKITGISGLTAGQKIVVTAFETGKCPAKSAEITVQEESAAPIITGSYCTATTISSISGISSEVGATISLYSGAISPVSVTTGTPKTTTVGTNGTWTVTGLSLPPGSFVAVTAKNASELVSNTSKEIEILSPTSKGTLAITSGPLTEGDAAISGTATKDHLIRLYIDGVVIEGFSTTADASGLWNITGLDKATAGYEVLFAGGKVSVTAQEGDKCESSPSGEEAIACYPPEIKTLSLAGSPTVCEGDIMTFELSATENLVVYQLQDQDGNATGSSFLGNGNPVNLTTGAITSAMTAIQVKALRIGIACETVFSSTSITVNPKPGITLGPDPVICKGETTATFSYSGKLNSPDRYQLVFNSTAIGQGFANVAEKVLPESSFNIGVPAAAAGGVYSATLILTNSATNCTSTEYPITITVTEHQPVLGAVMNPSACGGANGSFQLTGLLATTEYMVSYTDDLTAVSSAFTTDGSGALDITGLNAGSYTNIKVANSGCTSVSDPGPVNLSDPGSPAIAYGSSVNPSGCGITDGKIRLSNLANNTGYKAEFYFEGQFKAANGLMSDGLGNLDLTGLAAGEYTGLSVTTSGGCTSGSLSGPFNLSEPAEPFITLETNPAVSQGTTNANLSYTAATGNPDLYTITFDAAAKVQGFADVSDASLPASPIVITVPGTAATGTYNGKISVKNQLKSCASGELDFTVTVEGPGDAVRPAVAIQNAPSAVNSTTGFTVTFEFSEDVTEFVVGDITVTNGSASGFAATDANTYTALITPDAAGNISIAVAEGVAEDGAGNSNTAATAVEVVYDAVRPTVAIQNAPSAVNSTTGFTVTFEFSEDVTEFVVGDITLTNGSASAFAATDAHTYTALITPDAAGNVSIAVAEGVAEDGAGNTNTAATAVEVVYDAVRPAVVIQNAPSAVNSTTGFTVTFEFSEDVTEFVVGDITVTNGSASAFTATDANTYTALITPDAAGNISIAVAEGVAEDGAGNTNTAATAVEVVYDAVRPAVAIQNAPSAVNSTTGFTVTFEFSEDVTEFVVGDITVTNGSASAFTATDAHTYTALITPDAAGNISIAVAEGIAEDGAGNTNTAATTATIIYNTDRPAVAIQNAPSAVNSTTGFTVTFEFSEDVTEFVVGDITVTNGSASAFAATDAHTYTALITPDAAGNISIAVAEGVAEDGAGNSNTAATTATIIYNTDRPTVAIQNAPSAVNSTTGFTVTFEFSEDVTEFVVGDITVTNGSASAFTATDAHTYTALITPDAAGNISIAVAEGVAEDGAGNTNTAATTATIIYNTDRPAVAIQNAPSAVNSTTGFTVTFEFSEDVTEFVVGDITVTNGSASAFAATDAHTYTALITPDAAGDISIAVAAGAAQDGAGNTNTAATAVEVVYDAVRPTVAIQNAPSAVNSTTGFTVTFEFSEDVTEFVVGDITVTNGSASAFAATDANTYTALITPDAAGNISIAVAEGVAEDGAGNTNTAATTATIIYNTDRPTVAIQNAPSAVNSTTGFTVTFEFSEDVTEFVVGDITVTNGSASAFTATDANTYTALITPDAAGNISIAVAEGIAEDGAGNSNSAATTVLVTYNSSVPVITNATVNIDENLANGTEVHRVAASEPAGLALTYSIVDGNASGAFVISATSGYISVADGTKLDYETLTQFLLTVRVTNGTNSADGVITINLIDVNENLAPEVTDAAVNINENTISGTLVHTLMASDPDGNPLTYTIKEGNSSGAFAIDETGKITVEEASKLDFESAVKTFTLKVEVSDGTTTSIATITINLNNVNEVPVLENKAVTHNEDETLQGNLLINAIDPDGNILTVNPMPINRPEHGSLTIHADGSYTYTPDEDYFGTDSFTYEVCDNGIPSLCSQAAVSITILPVNDAPAVSMVQVQVTEGFYVSDNLLTNATDKEGDRLAIDALPVNGPSNGRVEIQPDGSYTYTPNAGYKGTDSFTYRICDVQNPPGCSEGIIKIEVVPFDSDNDVIPDEVEKGPDPANPVDTDRDGIPDYQDDDSDNDGIPDSKEAGSDPENPVDTEGDGIPDYRDTDSDNDGVSDAKEAGGDPSEPSDTDGDGIPDYHDSDDDNDGIPTIEETGKNGNPDPDCDGDGIPDYVDMEEDCTIMAPVDTDGDGIPDEVEKDPDPANPVDTDRDGIPDYQDDDSDNDGIPDSKEAGFDPENPMDTDGDGIPDYRDIDDDNDGIPTSKETEKSGIDGDCDFDGTPDYLDMDICGLVIPKGFSPNNDGTADNWIIEGIEEYPKNKIRVFNRWGNTVFETEGYNNQNRMWSGESDGRMIMGKKEVPDGTYFYVLDLGDGSKAISGFVVIKR